MPEELRTQVPLIKELLIAMGVPVISKAGIEADDILGTISRQWEEGGYTVTIVSGDKDLLQLVTDKIKLLQPKTAKGVTTVTAYFAEDVENEFSLPPEGIIELKALMGDSSDNIPGVPKIGPKTATELLIKYGNIENLKEHISEISRKSVRETLTEHFNLAELSKTLATIDKNAAVSLSAPDAEITDLFTAEAFSLVKKLELKSLFKYFPEKEDESEAAYKTWRTVSDLGEVEEVFSAAAKEKLISFAAGLNAGRIELLSICSSSDFVTIKAQGFVTSSYLKAQLLSLVEKSAGSIYTVRLKELCRIVPFPSVEKLYDLEILLYLLDPSRSSYDIPDDAPTATAHSFKEGEGYLRAVEEAGMGDLFSNVEMPLVPVLANMEKEGIRVKPEELKYFSTELEKRIVSLESSIYEGAGEEFNINSPKQLGAILFDKLKLPGGKKTKTGYSTSAEVLEKLAIDAPFVREVLSYRQLSKLKSTYADALTGFIREEDRIHSTFHQTITATGRLSSADPNLQNIPIRTELGREFRKIFIPRDGYCFIDADYSQIELRILASLSGDEKLIEAYREGKDIHAITASQVFHVPFSEVTEDLRRNAKAVNFGIVYGISSFGLSQDLSISRSEAKNYIDRYFETYPKVKAYLDSLIEKAKNLGYAETYFHRRRPVPELKNSNFATRSFGERVAMNAPIQGTAADIIKIAMVRVYGALKSEGLESKLILQVHDELLVETKEGEEDRVREMLIREMTGAADLAVPLLVDVKMGKSWYEAH